MCQFPAAKVAQSSFRHRKQHHKHHCHHCYGRSHARLGVLVVFFRGRRARPLPVAGDQGQTMWTSTHGQWKKEVQEESEDVVFDAWRKHLQREGWCARQWRRVKIYVSKLIKDHNNDARREGDLLRCGESGVSARDARTRALGPPLMQPKP